MNLTSKLIQKHILLSEDFLLPIICYNSFFYFHIFDRENGRYCGGLFGKCKNL